MLILAGCNKGTTEAVFPFPVFKFGTKVVVISGFYQGQTGTVVDYTDNYSTDCPKGYRVKFNSNLIEKPQFICHGSLSEKK